MADNYAESKTNQDLLAKAEAAKKIYEHNRDYFSVDLTLPLGNKALKQVHTNQWLFADLPEEFNLLNWTLIAESLNSNVNRYVNYKEGRWYIESVEVSVEAGGSAEMKLGLNAFASSYTSYADTVKDMQKAFRDAVNAEKQSKEQDTSNAVTTKNSVINDEWVRNYGVPDIIVNKIKEICSVNNSDEDNVKAWFNWMDDNINWVYYTNHQRSEEEVINRGEGNCVDNSRVFRGGCLALGVKCNFVKNSCISHQYNMVYLNGNGIVVDTGRELASWGSHWGSEGCPNETEESW